MIEDGFEKGIMVWNSSLRRRFEHWEALKSAHQQPSSTSTQITIIVHVAKQRKVKTKTDSNLDPTCIKNYWQEPRLGNCTQAARGLCQRAMETSPDSTGSATRAWECGARPPTKAHLSTGAPHSAEALGVPELLLSVQTARRRGSLPAPGRGFPGEGQGRESLRWHLSPWFHRSFTGGMKAIVLSRTEGSKGRNRRWDQASETKPKSQEANSVCGARAPRPWDSRNEPSAPLRTFRGGFSPSHGGQTHLVPCPALYWLSIVK